MYDVKVIRSCTELRNLADQWEALLERSGTANVFLTWEWIGNWIEVYLPGKDLLAIAVYDGDRLVGIAPFWIEKRRTLGMPSAKFLRLAGSPEADYVDILTDRKKTTGCVERMWEELVGTLRPEWDVIEIHDIMSDSVALEALLEKSAEDMRNLRVEAVGHSVCPYIALPDSWETFLAGFSRSGRYTITSSGRRLAQQGDLEFRVCEDAGDVEGRMTDFISLHQKNWRAKGHPGAFAEDKSRVFHHRVARAMFEKGRLFLASLHVGGRHIGSLYGFYFENRVFYYLLGVETNPVKRIKNGTALLAMCVKEAIERGCSEFDFLRGAEEYKYRWTELDRRNLRVRIYNRSAMGSLWFRGRMIRLALMGALGMDGKKRGS